MYNQRQLRKKNVNLNSVILTQTKKTTNSLKYKGGLGIKKINNLMKKKLEQGAHARLPDPGSYI